MPQNRWGLINNDTLRTNIFMHSQENLLMGWSGFSLYKPLSKFSDHMTIEFLKIKSFKPMKLNKYPKCTNLKIEIKFLENKKNIKSVYNAWNKFIF